MKIGAATITPIFEIDAGQAIQEGIPDAQPRAIKKIAWLRPHYADNNGRLKAQVQAFLVEAGGKKIVVDTGIGDGRTRPGFSVWANLWTGFMERFKKVCLPEDVNMVLCTHMHFDHTGWNTSLVNGMWTPTFPNAQYIFNEREFKYWSNAPEKEAQDDTMSFAESIMPVYNAGLAKLVPSDYRVIPEVSFIPTPGHTPGHIAILIESQGESAVISGDALHHPCQIAHPDWGTPWDTDPKQANKSRRALLERFANTKTLFIGAHFSEPVAGRIVRTGNSFKLV